MSWPEEVKRVRDAVVMRLDLSIRGTGVYDATRAAVVELTSDPELVDAVMDEIFGLGPLEALLQDGDVRTIVVDAPDAVRVERHGAEVPVARGFRDDEHLQRIADRILQACGQTLPSAEIPRVETTLGDGTRLVASWQAGRTTLRIVRPPVPASP